MLDSAYLLAFRCSTFDNIFSSLSLCTSKGKGFLLWHATTSPEMFFFSPPTDLAFDLSDRSLKMEYFSLLFSRETY